jgi:hypothetical protein
MVLTEGEAVPVSAAQHVEDTNGAPSSPCGYDAASNRTLIEAIAKGHRWQAQLEPACRQAGPGSTPVCPERSRGVEDLAKDVGCDRTYVGRMLRLTSLAPDIIEAILRGDEPDGLSLEKLRKNLPVRWDE